MKIIRYTLFGRWLKNKMEALNITDVELADQMGKSIDSIRHWMRGVLLPSRVNIVFLAKALGEDYQWLEQVVMTDVHDGMRDEL